MTVEGQVSGSEEALRTSPSRVALVRDHTSASLARLRLAGAAPPASRGSSLGSLGRLLAMRKKNPVRSDVYPCLSSGSRRAKSPRGEEARAAGAHVALRASRWCAIAAGSRIARLLPRSARETPRDAKIQENRLECSLCSGTRRAKSPRGEEARAAGARAREGPGARSSPFGRAASRCARRAQVPSKRKRRLGMRKKQETLTC